jgi:hypothetical protein
MSPATPGKAWPTSVHPIRAETRPAPLEHRLVDAEPVSVPIDDGCMERRWQPGRHVPTVARSPRPRRRSGLSRPGSSVKSHGLAFGGATRRLRHAGPQAELGQRAAELGQRETDITAREEAVTKAEAEAAANEASAPEPEPQPEPQGNEPWNMPGPDLDCADIGHQVTITGPDYHDLDRDGDGIGCESY